MIRIIVDTQSNRLFRGVEMEQDYDQRGGLCQAGRGDIVITTNPINPEYVRYWSKIGFDLPHLLRAGPFDPQRTLSELIIGNVELRSELKRLIGNSEARLEFFTIEESERRLAAELGIDPYCNFDVSVPLSRKHNFKALCQEIGLPTPVWELCAEGKDFLEKGSEFLKTHGSFLLKTNDGTGGISCGGMARINNEADLQAVAGRIEQFGSNLVLEKILEDKAAEVSIHWEMQKDGGLKIVDVFGQLSVNFTYAGAFYPAVDQRTEEMIKQQLETIFAPRLKALGALGFYCCDVLIDEQGEAYWIDFNPRKGAIIYAYTMVKRITEFQGDGRKPCFFHKHNQVGGVVRGKEAFRIVEERLADLSVPGTTPFVVITNPGVMEFGYLDLTGISFTSLKEAREVFDRALRRF